MKILLAEDDARVASFVQKGLREERFTVDVAPDGEKALFLAETGDYDLAVFDILLPKKSGMEVLKTLRSRGSSLPVLFLTAKDRPKDRVAGLEAGADDYLVKPFSFEELVARVRALLRRRGEMNPAVLRVEDLELDTRRRRALRAGREIELTAREYKLLEFLMIHAGRVVSRTTLAEKIWEHDFDTFSNVIDVQVARLRRKVDDDFPVKLIRTVRGSGYVLEAAPET
ncbi:MAG TPA: response regulator [Candidatus Eisenbacteria bacterium]|nr:response regulator [Candidatus Eisenbacteria bacterium]